MYSVLNLPMILLFIMVEGRHYVEKKISEKIFHIQKQGSELVWKKVFSLWPAIEYMYNHFID